ncbi:unnamed protein product, partial [Ixodes hexagonus]
IAVGWLERRWPTFLAELPATFLTPVQLVRLRRSKAAEQCPVSTMDKAQEAAAMGALDYATSDLASTISNRDLLPPPVRWKLSQPFLRIRAASSDIRISMLPRVRIRFTRVSRALERERACVCVCVCVCVYTPSDRSGRSHAVSALYPSLCSLSQRQTFVFSQQLLKKNQRAQVSCVVEKKKASEVIAHEPKMLITPFGNMTTEPRMVHLTGERMVFSCITGTRDENPRNASTQRNGRVKRGIAEEKDCACNCSC